MAAGACVPALVLRDDLAALGLLRLRARVNSARNSVRATLRPLSAPACTARVATHSRLILRSHAQHGVSKDEGSTRSAPTLKDAARSHRVQPAEMQRIAFAAEQ